MDSMLTSSRDYAEYVSRALATPGGHLAIGWGGATLYYDCGWLSGCIPDQVKAEVISAGLPVIDSRDLSFEAVWHVGARGPMVAVGELASEPPYHALSYAPLAVVAGAYRTAGAVVFNLDPAGAGAVGRE